jgi:hypothetical protein
VIEGTRFNLQARRGRRRGVSSPLQVKAWIAPTGRGTSSGNSYANAAPLSSLASLIASNGSGYYNILADEASNGATAQLPVIIRGVDYLGQAAKATFQGTRTSWTLPADPETVTDTRGWTDGGAEVFRLSNTAASYITFKDLYFKDIGGHTSALSVSSGGSTTIYASAGPIAGLKIVNCEGLNVRRLLDTATGVALNGLEITNTRVVGFSKNCLRIRGDSDGISITDCYFDSGRQDGDNFAQGLQLEETAHNITVLRCSFKNAHDTINAYANGDGISAEANTYNLYVYDTTFSGHTDGGVDIKCATGTVWFERCTFTANKRNIRIWQRTGAVPMYFVDCVSENPWQRVGSSGNPCHVFVTGGATSGDAGGVITMTRPILRGAVTNTTGSTGNVSRIEGHNGVIYMQGATISNPSGVGDFTNQVTSSITYA